MKRTKEHLQDKSTKKLKKNLNIFQGISIHVLSARFGPSRYKLFCQNVEKYGGIFCPDIEDKSQNITHVITEETIDKETLFKILNVEQLKEAKFIKCTWLSKCLKYNSLLPIEDNLIYEKDLKPIKTLCSNFQSNKSKFLQTEDNYIIQNENKDINRLEPKSEKMKESNIDHDNQSMPHKIIVSFYTITYITFNCSKSFS